MSLKRDYEQYREWATVGDHEKLDALLKHGSQAKAAQSLGLSERPFRAALQRLRMRAAQQGYAPENDQTRPVPNAQTLGGVSTLYGEDGQIKAQWVKSKDKKDQEIISLIDQIELKPLPAIKEPKGKKRKLCALYTITDFHIGMYSWAKECGEEWNTEIAGETYLSAMNDMVKHGQEAEEAILNIQGDFLHYDSMDAITPMNKHLLDSDTRFPKMAELSMDLILWSCELLLKTHKRVRVVMAQGNHDLVSMIWLRKIVKNAYKKNSRLILNDSESEYYAELFGKTFIGIHHGHRIKREKLPHMFSCDHFTREMWGKAAYSHIHCGHYHHQVESNEVGGAVVTQHPTLSPRDSYAVKHGYMSRSRSFLYIYDDQGDEVSRYSVRPPEVA